MDLTTQPVLVEEHRKQLETFVSFFGDQFHVIYRPQSGRNISASKVFRSSRIFYVDSRPEIARSFKRKRFDFYQANVNVFELEMPADLVIMFEAREGVDQAANMLRLHGYFLCDDTCGAASMMRKHRKFREKMAIRKEVSRHLYGRDLYVADTLEHTLKLYWTSIETNAEFIEHDVLFRMRRALDAYGTNSNGTLVERYRALYTHAEKETQCRIGAHDALERVFADPCDPASLLPPLPSKRGDLSTLHVFEKIERNDSNVSSTTHESGEMLIAPNSSIVSRAGHETGRKRRSS